MESASLTNPHSRQSGFLVLPVTVQGFTLVQREILSKVFPHIAEFK